MLAALGATFVMPASAQVSDGEQALMATVASYNVSSKTCYYADEVAPIIAKMDDYLFRLYGDEWTVARNQLEVRLEPTMNAWRMTGVSECSFYGQGVARGLQIAPIMFGVAADKEVARLMRPHGAYRLKGAPSEVVPETPKNPMAEFMEQYDANNSQGDLELVTVNDPQGGYKIVANDIHREGTVISMYLEAKGSRIDHRQIRIDCAAGTVTPFNEFNVRDDAMTATIEKMEEAQSVALQAFCDDEGGD